MNKKLMKVLAAAAVLVAGAGNATAADMDYDPIAVWDGFYGGFGVGYGWSKESVSVDGIETFTGLFDGADTSGESALSSIHLGYQKQSGSWVFGGQVTGILSDFNSKASASDGIIELSEPNDKGEVVGFFATTEDDVKLQTDGMFTVAGRAGFAHGDTLFYGIGGLASAEISTRVSSSGQIGICIPNLILVPANCDTDDGFDPNNPSLPDGLAGGAAFGQTSERHYGFVVGGGIEHKVNQFLSFGVEYNYTKLGAETHSGNYTGEIVVLGIGVQDIDEEYKIKVDPDGLHQIKATASIHFN